MFGVAFKKLLSTCYAIMGLNGEGGGCLPMAGRGHHQVLQTARLSEGLLHQCRQRIVATFPILSPFGDGLEMCLYSTPFYKAFPLELKDESKHFRPGW